MTGKKGNDGQGIVSRIVGVNESLIAGDGKVARSATDGNANYGNAGRKVYDGNALRATVNDKQCLAISSD